MTGAQIRIAVVDGATLNPGDLSWSGLEELGETIIYDRTSPDELASRVASAHVIITNKVPLGRALIEQLSQLRYIGVSATGYDCVDVNSAKERNVVVTNVPTYGTRSVAQMTFALLLELTQHVGHHDQAVKSGRWSECSSFCFWDYPLLELDGLTMGIVGLGRIGQTVAGLAQAFGMKVIAHSLDVTPQEFPSTRLVDLNTLLRESDVVSLHCPLTSKTKGLINQERLNLMKGSALLINTSRGPLVIEEDLHAALCEDVIAGAAVDVLGQEPPPKDHVLFEAKNCIITPHIAWATRESRSRLIDTTVSNLQVFLQGEHQNVVSWKSPSAVDS